VLVGPPGVGKGGAIIPAVDILQNAGSSNMLTDRVTIQYCLEQIARGFNSVQVNAGSVSLAHDASCFISVPELQVFLRASDDSLLSSMNDLWDCRDGPSDYGTRSKGCFKIEKPCPTLLGGITPGQLAECLPTKSIAGGFTRRVNFVYESDGSAKLPWPDKDKKINQVFVDDLLDMSTLKGEFTFTVAAAKVFEDYYIKDLSSEFDDEAMLSYNTTRWVHATKVAICLSAAKGPTMAIDKSDMETAIQLIDTCADDLNRVFRSVGDSELATVLDKVLRFVETKGYATRQMILAALYRDIGSTAMLDVILATLESGGMLIGKQAPSGQTVFKVSKLKVQQLAKGAVIQ